MTGKSDSMRSSLSEDQIIALGVQAGEALNNPILTIVGEMILRDAQQKIDGAQPDHVKEVMWQKQRRQMVGEFFQNLEGFRGQAERMLAERQAQHDPNRQEQERMDQQGYGLNFGGNAR